MELIKTTLVSTLAGLAMYIVGFLIQHHFVMVSVGDSLIKTILYSCVTGISMLVTLIVVYLAFGLPELVGIKNRILLWKKK
jgi:cation transporter-like permease